MKMFEFWLKFHWSLFLMVQLTILHSLVQKQILATKFGVFLVIYVMFWKNMFNVGLIMMC